MTETYPVLPLRDIVVFPHMIVPLFVGRDKSVAALETAMAADKSIFLVSQFDPAEDDPDREALYDLGVVATVLQLLKLPDGTVRVLVEGQRRASLTSLEMRGAHLVAEVEAIEGDEPEGAEVSALMRSVVDQFENYAKLNKKLPAETVVGWGMAGARARTTWSNAVAYGLTAAASMVMSGLIIYGILKMVRQSTRRVYEGPVEAMVDVVRIIVEDAGKYLAQPEILLTLAVGGVVCGLITEWVGRNYP
jgi:ATP-dependent Lon protease